MQIVADVGGTKTALAQVSSGAAGITLSSIRLFINEEFSSFDAVLGAYLGYISCEQVTALGVAVAGPVTSNRCDMTNLPWVVDGEQLRHRFNVKKIVLHNDLVASGYGLEVISDEALSAIRPGNSDPDGNRVLISPGTGLGETIIHATGTGRIPIPSEGGHADFAPIDGTTARLWSFMKRRQVRVPVEDLLSGSGINNIFRFLVSESGDKLDPEVEKRISARPGAAVYNRAIEDHDPMCVRTIHLFLDILAAEAGNMALKVLATGGVYFGGGIMPRLLPLLDRQRFVSIFIAKGKHRDLLAKIPLSVVTDTNLPLYGAGYHMLMIAGA